jgi:hypothetical protein
VQATSAEGAPLGPNEILELAAKCEWAELEDMSELLYSKQDFMHSIGLVLGWGDPVEAYKHGNSETAGVFFFNAYA